MLTIQVVLKDYTLILAYKLLMTFMLRQNTLCRQLSYRLGIPLAWGCLTAGTCWTMERLEDVELVAARLSIRRAAPLHL